MRQAFTLIALILCAAVATACANQDRYSEWKCGESLKSTMQSQVLNPEAGGDKPVTGMDGSVAMQAVKRYEKMGEEKKREGVMESMVDLYKGNQGSSK